jgi:hypothetical protein
MECNAAANICVNVCVNEQHFIIDDGTFYFIPEDTEESCTTLINDCGSFKLSFRVTLILKDFHFATNRKS